MSQWNKYDHTASSPCEFCVAPKRHIGCHSSCKDYKDFRAEVDRENEQRYKYNVKENTFKDYKKDGICKELKRRRK